MYKITGILSISDKEIGFLEIKNPTFRWVSVAYDRITNKLILGISFKEVHAEQVRMFTFDIPEGENVDASKLDKLMLSVPELSGAVKV